MSKYEATFIEIIKNNQEMMHDLALLRDFNLPNWYVAAGYVRNYMWDSLHNYSVRTPLNDIDVIYYDTVVMDEELEKEYEQRLNLQTGRSIWSVKNQARMHLRNGDQPYSSIEDAISYWPETVTAIAIKLEDDHSISYLCPYGLDDIFEYQVKKSPLFKDESYYRTRVNMKNWKEFWPRLEIIVE